MVGDFWELAILPALEGGMAAVRLNRYRFACPDPGVAVEIHGLEPDKEIPEAFGVRAGFGLIQGWLRGPLPRQHDPE